MCSFFNLFVFLLLRDVSQHVEMIAYGIFGEGSRVLIMYQVTVIIDIDWLEMAFHW